MEIAIVSGKGGAGKTTLATRLFLADPESVLLDCDVEEPNASLHLSVDWHGEEPMMARYPEIHEERCNHCGTCASFCAFKAILSGPAVTIPMPERCHDCGGCAMVCPQNAVEYKERPVGKISYGTVGSSFFAHGELNVGELSGVRMIRQLRSMPQKNQRVWIDGPPGTACAAVAAVEGADYVVVVGEPTPFGVSDMAMALDMLDGLKIPHGLVVNKAGIGNDEIHRYCHQRKVPILGEVPHSLELAQASAAGVKGWSELNPSNLFKELVQTIGFNAEKAQDAQTVKGGCA
ncbi:MAG: ATP-binding protein [Spirochaetales bacterium]|nr:ATP-binding protein [Spirochaetales bacterium]